MPCITEPSSEEIRISNEIRKNKEHELILKEIEYYKNKSDKATRLLCESMKIVKNLSNNKPEPLLSIELFEWYEHHKIWDNERNK